MNAERPKGPPVYRVALVSARDLGPNVRELELDVVALRFRVGEVRGPDRPEQLVALPQVAT